MIKIPVICKEPNFMSIDKQNETPDFFKILNEICKNKEERNFIVEDIVSRYGRGRVQITGISFFEKDSEFSFDEITGNVIKDEFGLKRKIEFKEHISYLF